MDNRDVVFSIFLNLSFQDLKNSCFVNKNLSVLCHNRHFWKQKYIQDQYPVLIDYPKNMKEYEQYITIFKRTDHLYDLIKSYRDSMMAALMINIKNDIKVNFLPKRVYQSDNGKNNGRIYKSQEIMLYDHRWGSNPKNLVGYENDDQDGKITIAVTSNDIYEILFKILFYYPDAELTFGDIRFHISQIV